MDRDRGKWQPNCRPPGDLVRPVPVYPLGASGPTLRQSRGKRWRRTTPGLFVPRNVSDDVPEQRILEQSMRLPVPDSAVTGWAACRMHGAAFFDGLGRDGRTRLPVPLALGAKAQIRPGAGFELLRARLTFHEVVLVTGVPCTVRRRALFDAMRLSGRVEDAVVAMDMMAAARLMSISRMVDYAGSHPAWTGIPLVRKALGLASERSRSPAETRMRLVWMLDANLPRPMVNQPVWDRSGTLLAIVDLLDPESGTVGEYDGADHLRAARRTKDVAREERLRDVGLEYFTVTGGDLPHRDRIVGRMWSTRARARWAAEQARQWTIEAPSWWRPEPTVDELLDLRELAEIGSSDWAEPA